ncbi:ribosome biogenesis protein [Candidatus Woesearchaeota archaeon]|nr:ribosome biogenesis protein [Candidatus Woesearchaeota archaeon]
MANHILKCRKCGAYSLSKECGNCGSACVLCQPSKYSPEDKYGKYRRQYIKEHSGMKKGGY